MMNAAVQVERKEPAPPQVRGAIKSRNDRDTAWLIDVCGELYRWSITAEDTGLEIRAQSVAFGGTLLIVAGLTYDPRPEEWRHGNAYYCPNVLFHSLPDRKVAEFIKLAREQGWRHDMEQQVFFL